MCAQGEVAPTWFKQKDETPFRIGGLVLMLATKDGWAWKAGEFGLIQCNDPYFTFTFEPEEESKVDWDLDQKILSNISFGGNCFELALKFYEACIAEGYDPSPEADEFLNEWLSKRMNFALNECEHVPEIELNYSNN